MCFLSVLPLPMFVHPYAFDNPSSKRKDLVVYTRRNKNTYLKPPLIHSSEPSNTPLLSLPPKLDESLPIALCKGKYLCTNHLISNFISYQSLNVSYTSFVNLVSSITVPLNLK